MDLTKKEQAQVNDLEAVNNMPGWKKFIEKHPYPAEIAKIVAAMSAGQLGGSIELGIQTYCLADIAQQLGVNFRKESPVKSLVTGVRKNVLSLGIGLSTLIPDKIVQQSLDWGKALAHQLDFATIEKIINTIHPEIPNINPNATGLQATMGKIGANTAEAVRATSEFVGKIALYLALLTAKAVSMKNLGGKAKHFKERAWFAKILGKVRSGNSTAIPTAAASAPTSQPNVSPHKQPPPRR